MRNAVTRVVLVLYALGSIAIAVPLLLDVEGTGDLAGTTSGRILAAAILALGFGAGMAARDPWQNRLVIQVLIAFCALATLAIIYRIVSHQIPHDPAWMVLPIAVAAAILLAALYPHPPQE